MYPQLSFDKTRNNLVGSLSNYNEFFKALFCCVPCSDDSFQSRTNLLTIFQLQWDYMLHGLQWDYMLHGLQLSAIE
ncbi:hypothetical protein FRX31_030105 [Thalictrum thalictroides]|uniref:Uncharacterized protein n=1 Tax=Thalictrum thalictroides TaxID=46969 RepID=A0A7J6V7D0_THATH|nr:hypothetical protein FRX31_030105 [Thalictrum thalictroides]